MSNTYIVTIHEPNKDANGGLILNADDFIDLLENVRRVHIEGNKTAAEIFYQDTERVFYLADFGNPDTVTVTMYVDGVALDDFEYQI